LDREVASAFLSAFARARRSGTVEPRHASWFDPEADALLAQLGVSRVGADPSRVPGAEVPLVANGLAYWRLHGSPVIYRSSYADRIGEMAAAMWATAARQSWCISTIRRAARRPAMPGVDAGLAAETSPRELKGGGQRPAGAVQPKRANLFQTFCRSSAPATGALGSAASRPMKKLAKLAVM
jgi:hypothetical protein